MKRVFRWILVSLGVVLGLLLLAAVLLPLLFDPNDHKQRIESLVSDRTGLPFTIGGEIGWSVFPWLGFETGPVELGNAPGFQEPHLVRIDRIGASVRLLPLLSREVEIAQIIIEGMDLRAEVNASGAGNWEILANAAAADSAEADAGGDEGSGLSAITVAGISVSDSAIHYVDAGSRQALESLALETGPIHLDAPIEGSLSFELASEALHAPGSAELAFSLTLPAGSDPLILRVASLALAAPLAEDLTVDVKLDQPLEYRSDATRLTLPQLIASGRGMQLTLDGEIANLQGTPVIRLQGRLPEFDPRPLLGALAGTDLAFADPEALSSLSGQFSARVQGDSASLPELTLSFDQTTAKLALELQSLATLSGTLNGEIDELNLDRYQLAPEADDEPDANAEAAEPFEIPGSLEGKLKIGRLVVAGAVAENIEMDLLIRNGGLRLFPFEAQLYGGSINGSIRYNPRDPNRRFVLKNNIKDLQSGPMLGDVAGSPFLDGLGTLVYELSLDDPFAAEPLRGLNGDIRFRFRDGSIYGVNVMGMFRQAAQLLKLGADLGDSSDPRTDFSSLVLEADVEQGVIRTRELSLQAPYFRLSGTGSIDLAGDSLDYTVTPVLVDTPQGQGGGALEELKGVAIPVRLGGSMAAPEWKIDVAKLLLASQKGKLDGPAADLLEALGGESEGGEKKDPGAALMDALMQEATKRSEKKNKQDKDEDSGT